MISPYGFEKNGERNGLREGQDLKASEWWDSSLEDKMGNQPSCLGFLMLTGNTLLGSLAIRSSDDCWDEFLLAASDCL